MKVKQHVEYFSDNGIIDNIINNYLDQHPGYSIYCITPYNKGVLVVFNIDISPDAGIDTETTKKIFV